MKKYKSKVFIFLVISLLFVVFVYLSKNNYDNIVFFDNNKYENYLNEILFTKEKNFNIITSININDKQCSYDNNSDSFLCFFDNSNMKNFRFKVESVLDYSLFSNSDFVVNNFDVFSIVMYTEKYYYVINLRFTNLPVMSLNSLPNLKMENYVNDKENISLDFDSVFAQDNIMDASNSYLSLIENDYSVINSKMDLRLRGHDSLIYDKKSYKLSLKKLLNNSYVNNDLKLLDMYKDDDWVLDAMYIDNSKIRNKFSSDLWRYISNENILNGKYIELFIDNDYKGLYLLKEYVSKKSLNVSENGSLFKSVLYLNQDDNNVHYIHDKYYLLRHPDNLNYSSINILSTMNDYYNYILNSNDVSNLISDDFDINNFLNYKIFISLIKGVDNNEYNNYYLAMKDENSKIIKIPWDMDLTFGLTFNRINDYELVSDMGFDIYYNNSYDLNNLIKERYWSLRKNKIIFDDMDKYIDDYKNILINSGATYRDSNRWNVEPVNDDIENIREWLHKRVEYLDEFFR